MKNKGILLLTLIFITMLITVSCTNNSNNNGDKDKQMEKTDSVEPEKTDENKNKSVDQTDKTDDNVKQKVAELDTKDHDVKGTAKVIDSSTIEIEAFSYDGKGPDVYVYLGSYENGKFKKSLRIGEKLTRKYDNETLVVKLPEGKSANDYTAISLWCKAFSVDFGSGKFVEK